MKPKAQEAQRTPNKNYPENRTQKKKRKSWKMLGGGDLIYRGTKIRITECFLLETMKTRKEERENGIKQVRF